MHEPLPHSALDNAKITSEGISNESSENDSKSDKATAVYQEAYYLYFKQLDFTEIPFSVEISPYTTTNDPPVDNFILCRLPNASNEAYKDGISECLLTRSVFSTILDTPGFPTSMNYGHDVPAYRIAQTGSMGLGMFAARAFDIGDLIIAERPLFVHVMSNQISALHKEYVHEAERNAMFESALKHIVDRLTEENRAKFFSLFNCHLKAGKDLPFSSIAATNSFGESFNMGECANDTAITHQLVMNDCSRINHSCCPNAISAFDIPSFSLQFRAVRPIAQGEEITRSYVPIELSYLMRKPELKRFGVKCGCPSCSASMLSKLYSGALRTSLNGHIAYLGTYLIDHSLSASELSGVFSIVQELVQNMDNEGIQGSKVYCMAIQVACHCAVTMYHAKSIPPLPATPSLDEMKRLLAKGVKVTLAHRGKTHQDCVWIMKELQSLHTPVV